jgi:hypothetical protein
VVGRSFWHVPGYPPFGLYIGAVTRNPDKSDRSDDIVQTLPTNNTTEALAAARVLRDMIDAQEKGYEVFVVSPRAALHASLEV